MNERLHFPLIYIYWKHFLWKYTSSAEWFWYTKKQYLLLLMLEEKQQLTHSVVSILLVNHWDRVIESLHTFHAPVWATQMTLVRGVRSKNGIWCFIRLFALKSFQSRQFQIWWHGFCEMVVDGYIWNWLQNRWLIPGDYVQCFEGMKKGRWNVRYCFILDFIADNFCMAAVLRRPAWHTYRLSLDHWAQSIGSLNADT